MRRTANVLTVISAIALVVVIGLWIFTYFIDLHIGRYRPWVALDGTRYDERSGLFLGGGQVAWAHGIGGDFNTSNLDLSKLTMYAVHPPRVGIFRGNFSWWYLEKDEDFIAGFGRNGTVPSISFGFWWIALGLLFLPGFRALGKLRHWTVQQTAVAAGTSTFAWGFVTVLAMFQPELAALIFFAAMLFACLLGLVSVPMYLTYVWRRARARRVQGRCRVCGYDVRATPDPAGPLLERCPECGTYTSPLRAH